MEMLLLVAALYGLIVVSACAFLHINKKINPTNRGQE
jgi:hypothetical protein